MKLRSAAVMVGLTLGLMSGSARAAFLATIEQVGPDVQVVGTGTLNTSGLTFSAPGGASGDIDSQFGELLIGSSDLHLVDEYSITGPKTIGTGSYVQPSSGSPPDNLVGFDNNTLYVPQMYVSGTPLSVNATFSNKTLADLGLTSNTYIFGFGTGVDQDTFTLVIGSGIPAPVPLPSSAPLFGAGLIALVAISYGLKRKGVVAT